MHTENAAIIGCGVSTLEMLAKYLKGTSHA
jgi:hypothetical protein